MMPLGFPVCAESNGLSSFRVLGNFQRMNITYPTGCTRPFSLLSRLDGKTRNCQVDPARRVVEPQLSLDYVRLP
jgi:hypothetical protein